MAIEVKKPPLGAMPAEIHAWRRIIDLAEAILRQARSEEQDQSLVYTWAEEITAQCMIIGKFKRDIIEKAIDALKRNRNAGEK